MALPADGTPWPPPHIADIWADMAEADVWYTGDRTALAEYYTTRAQSARHRERLRDHIWAQPRPLDSPERRLHIPLAGDIAAASADMLYSEPLRLTVDDPATQARLDELVHDGGMRMRLLECAEQTAALGDGYLTLAWDRDLVDRPILVPRAGDTAIPVLRYGRLLEVVFWQELARDGHRVIRLLERHAVEGGTGYIEYALYEGTSTSLGRRVDYGAHPDPAEAEMLTRITDDQGRQVTGIPMLTATHIPNVRPNRRHRGWYGRSDYTGIYDQMAALDQTWTSLMRDIRLGQGRVHLPAGALQPLGEGQGAAWDPWREAYTELEIPPDPSGRNGALTVTQFQIRVEEHLRTATALISSAVRSAGYSGETFGIVTEGGEQTATEVAARRSRTTATRERKVEYQAPAIRRIVEAMLALDRQQFGRTDVIPQAPTVEWPPAHQPTMLERAQTIQLLATAEAVSTELRVRMLHPDWTEAEITEEVARIRQDQAAAAPMLVDPFRDPDPVEVEQGAEEVEDTAE